MNSQAQAAIDARRAARAAWQPAGTNPRRAYLLGYTLLCLALGLALVAVVYLGTRP